jgi:DHA1 family bicyclomycin/chloramphenicol resistance-like MFS transporter
VRCSKMPDGIGRNQHAAMALTSGSRSVTAPSAMFIAALGLLMSFGPMAIDMYLPALPEIGDTFQVDQDRVQWSLSAFFFGFGIGQIFWGALADRFGRRRPIIAGILLYGIACIGCSLAPGIGTLAAWRFVQAFGACAGPVLARAMVRDVFDRNRAASVLSLMMLVMGVAPMVAPIIGGHILLVADWRVIFGVQAGFGALALAAVLAMAETLPPSRRPDMRIAGMAAAYLVLLRDRRYLGYALCSGFIYGGMFAYVSGTPYVYIETFGVRPENYGYLFGIVIVGMIVVNTVNSRLVLRFGSDKVLRIGCVMAGLAGIALLAVAVSGLGGLIGLATMLFLFMAMTGMIAANAMAGAMSVFPHVAGSASAFTGMLQFAFGAVCSWAVGFLANGSAVPMAAVICAVALASVAFNLALVRGTDEGRAQRPL